MSELKEYQEYLSQENSCARKMRKTKPKTSKQQKTGPKFRN